MKRIQYWLHLYLVTTSIIAHLALGMITVHVISLFLASGVTFANAATHTGNTLIKEHPSINPLGQLLITMGEHLEKKDYFWKPFKTENWSSIGPKPLHFTQLLPQAFHAHTLFVSNSKQLAIALKNVQPGTAIILKDGDYSYRAKRIALNQITPTQQAPIYIMAENVGRATLELDSVEGFVINSPFWHIIGLNMVGVCQRQAKCEHAIHVIGNGHHFYAAHNQFIDFNAAIKVNQFKGKYPDHGIIERNHFYFTKPRNVANSVTPINMDHGNNWRLNHNIIRDFVKIGGNRISYGAFFKGGVVGGEISNNLVICQSGDQASHSTMVGLSLGGGGMKKAHRRMQSDYETKDVHIKNNIVLHCNDVGLYVNKGANSVIYNNTFYNTYGLDLRFRQSSGWVFNNLLNGQIRHRDGASGELQNNQVIALNYWSGNNSMQAFYQAPSIGNMQISKPAQLPKQISSPLSRREYDFCSNPIEGKGHIGAIEPNSHCFYPPK